MVRSHVTKIRQSFKSVTSILDVTTDVMKSVASILDVTTDVMKSVTSILDVTTAVTTVNKTKMRFSVIPIRIIPFYYTR
jgi:hypothetical protein